MIFWWRTLAAKTSRNDGGHNLIGSGLSLAMFLLVDKLLHTTMAHLVVHGNALRM
jgi:hypothetical protein